MSDPKKGSFRSSGPKNTGQKSRVAFADYRFVRIELTEAEKVEFRSLLASGELEGMDIDAWLERGYKFTLTRDSKGGGVIASLSQQNVDSEDAGLILTGRGGDTVTAMAVLTYKDKYLAGDDGWKACEARRGGGYDDIG